MACRQGHPLPWDETRHDPSQSQSVSIWGGESAVAEQDSAQPLRCCTEVEKIMGVCQMCLSVSKLSNIHLAAAHGAFPRGGRHDNEEVCVQKTELK